MFQALNCNISNSSFLIIIRITIIIGFALASKCVIIIRSINVIYNSTGPDFNELRALKSKPDAQTFSPRMFGANELIIIAVISI